MNHFDVIIVGGGASGLMCALTAGKRGRRVLLLESSNKVGKKILMSGGGRCNFTNLTIEPDCFISENPHFCISALNRYTQWDFITLVEKHHIPYHERKHGQLFCNESAKDILAMLLAECEAVKVNIKTQCSVTKISLPEAPGNRSETTSSSTTANSNDKHHNEDSQRRFHLQCDKGEFTAHSLVIASGGLSIPTLGGSGFGYETARRFGLKVLPTRAGLVPFTFSDSFKAVSERLSGLAVDVDLQNARQSFQENVLFTHRGLSGPAVLQLSNYWLPGESISLDLLPGEDLAALLKARKKSHPKSLLRTLLGERLAKGLIQELQALFWPTHAETVMAEIPDAVLEQVARQLQAWSLKPSGTEGYRTAEVTLGGVDTDELSSKTMESKRQPGLYFIGEVVDVTGWLGGYNFQWAWSSGAAAGGYV